MSEQADADDDHEVQKREVVVSGRLVYDRDEVANFDPESLIGLAGAQITENVGVLDFEVNDYLVDGIHLDAYYVSDGDTTYGPYFEEHRAEKRRVRFTTESDSTYLLYEGDRLLDNPNIPEPEGTDE